MELQAFIKEQVLMLIPVLLVIGKVLKGSSVPDKYIPIILTGFGILGAAFLVDTIPEAVIQGILVAGASVYGNQIYKQLTNETK